MSSEQASEQFSPTHYPPRGTFSLRRPEETDRAIGRMGRRGGMEPRAEIGGSIGSAHPAGRDLGAIVPSATPRAREL
eukprot:4072993-Pleurochrysis_carterae.AAC.4